jgi:hypothetical protein
MLKENSCCYDDMAIPVTAVVDEVSMLILFDGHLRGKPIFT